MEIEEYKNFRNDLFDESRGDDGFIQESLLLSQVLPSMFESKLIDSEDYNECYHVHPSDDIKVNGYVVNESGERLQLFIIDEKTTLETLPDKEILISNRSGYEKQFKRVSKLIRGSLNGQLNEHFQDASPVKALVSQLSSVEGIKQFDVIEIFLITFTATVSYKGTIVQPKSIYFDEEKIPAFTSENGIKTPREKLILRRVIDLNFLLEIEASKGNREPLTVHFDKTFNTGIDAIKAADEKKFVSYLCVLPAHILVELYKRYSTRLLEKNVRSFLQFKGVNAGLKKTIKMEPEKFIAYNNGLTVTATSAKITDKKGKLQIQSLTDFQIVNGGQTTATIYFSKKEGLDISQVSVMAKINIVRQSKEKDLEKLISNISEFSNAQSRVSKVDLRSREPQLIKLKQLSQSVTTPTGLKWFFERAKGDYRTQVRIAGRNKNRIVKTFPTERRFTKELLAKYYSSWGDEPYKVKKGGEKIFRHFIEKISGLEDETPVEVNRDFFENVISRIILFRKMEKIYGQGKNSIGQLRSAVIPYSISVIYSYTNGSNNIFNLSKIWRKEGLEDDLINFTRELMLLMNELIKKYSPSDDYGEYSKRKELWESIKKSSQIKSFMNQADSLKIINKYTFKSN